MTDNAPPFSPTVRIYPGGDPMDASTWGVGQDVSAYVRHPGNDGGQPITYGGGRPEGATSADPGWMSLTLDNRDGRFSTRNPNGPYYGSLRRGTPVTLSMGVAEDTFTRTVSPGLGTADSGQVWTASSNWSVNGTTAIWSAPSASLVSNPSLADADATNCRARITVWPTVVATGASLLYGMTLRRADSSNYLLYSIEFTASTTVVAKIWTVVAGSATSLGSVTLAGTYSANDKWRVLVESDGGALRLKAWEPANPSAPDDDEPDAWSLTANDSSVTGSGFGLYGWRLSGNTNAGTVTFPFDDLEVEAVEFTGSVISWPVRWDKTGNNCWAPISASGIMRRLSRPSEPLRSPIYRQLINEDLTAYWPLEEESGATSYADVVVGGSAGRPINFSPAQDSTLPGAATSPVANAATASIKFSTSIRQTGTGAEALFFTKFPAATPPATVFATINAVGLVVQWELSAVDINNYRIRGLRSDGTAEVNILSDWSAGPLDWNAWLAWDLTTTLSAGTVSWDLSVHQVGAGALFDFTSSTYASTITPRMYGATLGGPSVDGVAYAHLWLGEATLPFIAAGFYQVADGYQGETAAARVARLCDEEGIPAFVQTGDSELMGRQRVSTLLDLLKECADTDLGVLYESGNGIGYVPRGAIYSRAVDLALTVASRDIVDPLAPEDDDQRVANDVTVSRVDGSSVRQTDQAHITAEGRYSASVSINPETDDVLASHAGWRLYLGTRTEFRWPGLSINLADRTSLIPSWRGRSALTRITVDTGLSQVETADPDVFMDSYSVELWPSGWIIHMDCSPAAPWDVNTLDSGVRLDTEASELASSVTTSATSWSVSTTSGPIWVTTALHSAEFPFDILCDGELVTVTSITGTSSPQTFTVTRSVNGIVKAHDAGASVALAVPTYLAL